MSNNIFFGPILRTISYPWLLLVLTFCCHPKTFFFELENRYEISWILLQSICFLQGGIFSWRIPKVMRQIKPMQVRVLCKSFWRRFWLWLNNLWIPVRQTLSYHLQCWVSCLTWNGSMCSLNWISAVQMWMVLKTVTKRHFRSLSNGAEINFST